MLPALSLKILHACHLLHASLTFAGPKKMLCSDGGEREHVPRALSLPGSQGERKGMFVRQFCGTHVSRVDGCVRREECTPVWLSSVPVRLKVHLFLSFLVFDVLRVDRVT